MNGLFKKIWLYFCWWRELNNCFNISFWTLKISQKLSDQKHMFIWRQTCLQSHGHDWIHVLCVWLTGINKRKGNMDISLTHTHTHTLPCCHGRKVKRYENKTNHRPLVILVLAGEGGYRGNTFALLVATVWLDDCSRWIKISAKEDLMRGFEHFPDVIYYHSTTDNYFCGAFQYMLISFPNDNARVPCTGQTGNARCK